VGVVPDVVVVVVVDAVVLVVVAPEPKLGGVGGLDVVGTGDPVDPVSPAGLLCFAGAGGIGWITTESATKTPPERVPMTLRFSPAVMAAKFVVPPVDRVYVVDEVTVTA
jgi:hypothetical protein